MASRIEEIGVESSPPPGLEQVYEALRDMVYYPLIKQKEFEHLNIKPVKGILLHGAPGVGKTMIVRKIAERYKIAVISINSAEITNSAIGKSERQLREKFEQARVISESLKQPVIVFIDEIEALASKRKKDESTEIETRLLGVLLTQMDGIIVERGNVVVIGATNRPNDIDEALRRPGRLEREVYINVPDQQTRRKILEYYIRKSRLNIHDEKIVLDTVAENTSGYVGADLMALVREALLNSLARQKRIKNSDYSSTGDEGDGTDSTDGGAVFVLSDFMEGLKIIEPSLKRGLEMEVQSSGLQPGTNIEIEIQGEVGGLSAVRRALDKCIRWPLEHGDKLARLGAVQPNGILLYGPPGCSKTTLVREYAQRFGTLYMISGADIFSCYVGESERTIRSTFLKARLTKPSIIFVDELECIVSKRGSDTSQQDVVRDRILTTFLNELDGVSSTLKSKTKGASQVMLIGSTNRPDLIDEALLRPGRFDKLIYVGPPTDNERMEIAKKLLQQGGIEGLSDIEYQKIITATSGGCCTMADLHKLCTVIKMNEFKKQLKYSDGPENGKEGASNRMDIRTLDEILVNFQPSLSEQMVSFYEDQLKNLY